MMRARDGLLEGNMVEECSRGIEGHLEVIALASPVHIHLCSAFGDI